MKVRIVNLFCRVTMLALTAALLFAACGPVDLGIPPDPLEKSNTPSEQAALPSLFDNPKDGNKPTYPNASHLARCTSDSDCFGGTRCINLFGEQDADLCYFRCDPKKGIGDVQNPGCIEPENCIELTSSDGTVSGICIALPGQLYGIGGYKAVVSHKQGESCLLRYGGCDIGLICVDTGKNGSIGTCEESCTPKSLSDSKNSPSCKTAGTKCVELASGAGACLK